MRKLNLLFTLYSIDVLIITLERLTGFTDTLLQPYNFTRLHYLIQGPILLAIAVILSLFFIKEITNNFATVKTKTGFYLLTAFVVGAYLFGFGEGWHELGSFTFNYHCDVKNFTDDLCGGLFINNYFTGNILFYLGFFLMSPAIMFLEKLNPTKAFNRNQLIILFINSTIYSFSHFAYAAFDRVLIGLTADIILMLIALGVFYSIRKNWRQYPYITYSAFAYTLATVTSLVVRLSR